MGNNGNSQSDPNSQHNVIHVENLAASYEDDVVLRDVSFDVRRGEVFVIMGGSGCGKSTLLKMMIGLIRPTSGRILILGKDIHKTSGSERSRLVQRFGVTYQSGALFGSMTLLENVRLPLEEFSHLPPHAMDLIAQMKLKQVDLGGFADHMPAQLSGGMQKRGAIARAMVLDPEILFLDEPSAGLDPITSAEIDALILALARNLGITFVIVSHELDSIYTVADRVIMLDKRTKGIVATGKPADLRDHSDNPWVRQFLRGEATADREHVVD
jgi:phospholipid/cholesterol/gamma-HCH transport system ATP-binding protein